MHFILLFLIAPFALLLAGIAAGGLLLLASFALEFPLVFLSAVGIGWTSRFLVKTTTKRNLPCEQP